ncbi:MAG: 6,7-dimethyl-8-ribityllumazine synthase [Muribaculum sp.]|nr:6,7-dimethyl-8-ribityllumazine synthase [Muribaculum sp.]
MSTILNTNGESLQIPELADPRSFKCVIVTAAWNPAVTHALRDGARKTLQDAGVDSDRIRLIEVPGTVELVNAAALAMKSDSPSAIIIIGCVIRGDTPHFDYVCQQVAQGTAILNARGDTPVIFGVLTVDNLDQALERAGGTLGNKGSEAACAAITMSNLHIEASR